MPLDQTVQIGTTTAQSLAASGAEQQQQQEAQKAQKEQEQEAPKYEPLSKDPLAVSYGFLVRMKDGTIGIAGNPGVSGNYIEGGRIAVERDPTTGLLVRADPVLAQQKLETWQRQQESRQSELKSGFAGREAQQRFAQQDIAKAQAAEQKQFEQSKTQQDVLKMQMLQSPTAQFAGMKEGQQFIFTPTFDKQVPSTERGEDIGKTDLGAYGREVEKYSYLSKDFKAPTGISVVSMPTKEQLQVEKEIVERTGKDIDINKLQQSDIQKLVDVGVLRYAEQKPDTSFLTEGFVPKTGFEKAKEEIIQEQTEKFQSDLLNFAFNTKTPRQKEYEQKNIEREYEKLSGIDKFVTEFSSFGTVVDRLELEAHRLGLFRLDYSSPKTQKAESELKISTLARYNEMSGLSAPEYFGKYALESPLTMFIPVTFAIGAGTKALKFGLSGASFIAREKFGAQMSGAALSLGEKLVDPSIKTYFGYQIGKEIVSSESPQEAFGKIGAFALAIPSGAYSIKKGESTTIGLTESLGLGRAKTYGYGKEQTIPYKSRGEAIENILENPTIKIVTARQDFPKGAQRIRSPSEIGDIGYKSGAEQGKGYFGTIASDVMEPFGSYFLNKGDSIAFREKTLLTKINPETEKLYTKTEAKITAIKDYAISEGRRLVSQPSVSLQTVETVRLSPELKSQIYKSFKETGKAEQYAEEVYKIAKEQSAESGRPVAVPSPKRFAGVIEPENEAYILYGGKTIKGKVPVQSTKFKGFTKEGAVVVESSFGESGKAFPLKSESFLTENIRFNPEKKIHFLEQQKSEGIRKTQELYEGKFSLPGEYGQHGVSHARNVYTDLMKSYETSPKLQKEFTPEEYKQAASLASKYHDIVKISEGETEPFTHAEAGSKIIKEMIKREGIDVSPKVIKTIEEAIERHEKNQPLSAFSSEHGTLGQIIETAINRPSTFSKAMSNADRRDLARMGIKVESRNIFDIGVGKEVPKVKFVDVTKKVEKIEYKDTSRTKYVPSVLGLDKVLGSTYDQNVKTEYVPVKTAKPYEYGKEESKYTLPYDKKYESPYTPPYDPKYSPEYKPPYEPKYEPKYTPEYKPPPIKYGSLYEMKYPRPYLDRYWSDLYQSEVPVDEVFAYKNSDEKESQRKKLIRRKEKVVYKPRESPIFGGAEKLFENAPISPLRPTRKTQVKQNKPSYRKIETFDLGFGNTGNPLGERHISKKKHIKYVNKKPSWL